MYVPWAIWLIAIAVLVFGFGFDQQFRKVISNQQAMLEELKRVRERLDSK
jgi:hypothetical protein